MSERQSKTQNANNTADAGRHLVLECPAHFGPVAQREWDRILSAIPNSVEIEECDWVALAIYCNAYVRWCEATEALEKYGSVLKSPNGHPVQSPYVSIANHEAATMLRIANDFGFTPAGRNRLPWRPSSDGLELQPMGF
jgi:P27 family predicted phage terminase small subunit